MIDQEQAAWWGERLLRVRSELTRIRAESGQSRERHWRAFCGETAGFVVSLAERLTQTYCSCRLTEVSTSAAAVLDALGDANRRSILEGLADGPLAVGVLADRLPISRPAVSQHLRVLKEAELVIEAVAGTRHLYRINPSGLRVARDYLDGLWSTALDNFAMLAAAEAGQEAVTPLQPPTSPKRSRRGRTDREEHGT